MIKVESCKVHKIVLTVMNGKTDLERKLYEWCKTHKELEKIGKYDTDLNDKIFDFLRIETRDKVPYKKVASPYPSFRIIEIIRPVEEDVLYKINAEWHITGTETDFII